MFLSLLLNSFFFLRLSHHILHHLQSTSSPKRGKLCRNFIPSVLRSGPSTSLSLSSMSWHTMESNTIQDVLSVKDSQVGWKLKGLYRRHLEYTLTMYCTRTHSFLCSLKATAEFSMSRNYSTGLTCDGKYRRVYEQKNTLKRHPRIIVHNVIKIFVNIYIMSLKIKVYTGFTFKYCTSDPFSSQCCDIIMCLTYVRVWIGQCLRSTTW